MQRAGSQMEHAGKQNTDGEMWNYDAYVCGKIAVVMSTSM